MNNGLFKEIKELSSDFGYSICYWDYDINRLETQILIENPNENKYIRFHLDSDIFECLDDILKFIKLKLEKETKTC